MPDNVPSQTSHLAKLLQHDGLVEHLAVGAVIGQPDPAKVLVHPLPVVRPQVDGRVVNACAATHVLLNSRDRTTLPVQAISDAYTHPSDGLVEGLMPETGLQPRDAALLHHRVLQHHTAFWVGGSDRLGSERGRAHRSRRAAGGSPALCSRPSCWGCRSRPGSCAGRRSRPCLHPPHSPLYHNLSQHVAVHLLPPAAAAGPRPAVTTLGASMRE